MWAFPDRRSLVFERFPVSAPRPDSVENEIILRPSSDIYVLSPTLSAHTLTSVREFPHFSVLHGVALTRAPHQETILQAKHGAVITCVPRDLDASNRAQGWSKGSTRMIKCCKLIQISDTVMVGDLLMHLGDVLYSSALKNHTRAAPSFDMASDQLTAVSAANTRPSTISNGNTGKS